MESGRLKSELVAVFLYRMLTSVPGQVHDRRFEVEHGGRSCLDGWGSGPLSVGIPGVERLSPERVSKCRQAEGVPELSGA